MARSKAKQQGLWSKLQDNALVEYLRNTRAEMRKVHWPSREEAQNLTKIVLAVTFAMSAFLGILDYLFSMELRGLIAGNAVAIGVAVIIAVVTIVTVIILKRQSV